MKPLVPRRVAVLGCGYVGVPVALLAVAAGHDVVAIDTDLDRIVQLEAGKSYIVDVTDADLADALGSGRLLPTADPNALAGFDIVLITVPTPLDRDGDPDLTLVEAAAKHVAAQIEPGCTVVLESSTYPGTTQDIVLPILERSGLRAGIDFHLGYSPERIDPGMGLAGLRAVPKIVAGIDDASTAVIAEFWRALVAEVVVAPDIRTAELAKLFENVFRLVNVSLVNELAQHARALGADVRQALALAETKPFGFMRFHPGVGAGGHCLPVDTRYLSWQIRTLSGTPAVLIETASRINDAMPTYVADRIVSGLDRRGVAIESARIVAVGVTYKRDVADLRESCALEVIRALRRYGAEVVTVDPTIPEGLQVLPRLTADIINTASGVAVLVGHTGLDLNLISTANYVFDACGALPTAPNIEHL
ncbi:nucleotide sugar dehydrogenase [Nocardia fluminea]|uniref:nucleotide sugar dehydrogenase n=1 Tax=Nocardia fluminea TaxID=134984 RepID=UPI0033E76552